MSTGFVPPTLASETIFYIGTFEVRNTLITAVMTLVFLTIVALLVRRKKYAMVPSGIQNMVEALIGGFFDFFAGVIGDREKAKKFFPLVATIFFFVLISNWMGLFPGFSSIGFKEVEEGKEVFVPLFRSTFSDVNMTFALALISVTACQIFGFSLLGFKGYAGKFFVNPFRDPIGCFVGLLEILSEFAKMISFTFRLFGNVFAGEVLLAVIAFLLPWWLPGSLPFYGLEVFVGFIQALVFSFLTLIFLKVATTTHEHSECA